MPQLQVVIPLQIHKKKEDLTNSSPFLHHFSVFGVWRRKRSNEAEKQYIQDKLDAIFTNTLVNVVNPKVDNTAFHHSRQKCHYYPA